MKFLTEWRTDATNSAHEEKATVCDFFAQIGQTVVTRHSQGGVLDDSVTVSVYGLVEGIVHDWWRIFCQRDRVFSFVKYRGGFLLPDIRMRYDGEEFKFFAEDKAYEGGAEVLRFSGGASEVMSRHDAERSLSDLIDATVKRLAEARVLETPAALRWSRVRASLASEDEVEFCEAAGALGVDPYRIDGADASFILETSKMFAGEARLECLSGANKVDKGKLLNWINSAQRRPRYQARLADLSEIVATVAQAAPERGPDERSWARGYRRARAFRRILGIGQAERVKSYKSLATKLGAGSHYAVAQSVDGIRALRSDQADGIYIHLRDHGRGPTSAASHTFSFARAIGDAACFPDHAMSCVNDLHAAYRQAAGRAFAAELLAPIEEIKSMRRDGRDEVTIAAEFGVSTAVVKHQLENSERIELVCAA